MDLFKLIVISSTPIITIITYNYYKEPLNKYKFFIPPTIRNIELYQQFLKDMKKKPKSK